MSAKLWSVPPLWRGETVFILAGGASVLGQDLSALAGSHVIAINSAWRTYPHADVLFFADSRWWTKFHPDFAGLIVTTCEWSDKRIRNLKKIAPGKGLAESPDRLALQTTSVTGAINLAVHFGAARIVLLGVDGQIVQGRRHHHDEAYPWPLVKGCFDKHAAEFKAIAPSLAKLGVEVINANPNSAIDVWPKLSFGDVVSMLQRLPLKPSLVVMSMYGMGDCIHERAVVRELMKTNDVELQTYYTSMFHDLEAEGLRVTMVDRPNLPPRIRDAGNAAQPVSRAQAAPAKLRPHDIKIGYDHAQTKRHGTLLDGMFGSVGMQVPERPDFSLPVKPEWRDRARKLVQEAVNAEGANREAKE